MSVIGVYCFGVSRRSGWVFESWRVVLRWGELCAWVVVSEAGGRVYRVAVLNPLGACLSFLCDGWVCVAGVCGGDD